MLLYIGRAAISFIGLLFLSLFFRFRIKYLKNKRKEALLEIKLKEGKAMILEIEKENSELMPQLKEEANKLQKEVLAKHTQVSHKNQVLKNL